MSRPRPATDVDELAVELRSAARHLRATNLSGRTRETYLAAMHLCHAFLWDRGMPLQVAHVRREHVEAFIVHLLETRSPVTAKSRWYDVLRAFFTCLVETASCGRAPWRGCDCRRCPSMPPVLTEGELRRLLPTCERGQGLGDRRDRALLLVLSAPGARLSEVAGRRYHAEDPDESDVDLEQGVLYVLGRGGRERMLPLGREAVRALDRYRRVRDRSEIRDSPWPRVARRRTACRMPEGVRAGICPRCRAPARPRAGGGRTGAESGAESLPGAERRDTADRPGAGGVGAVVWRSRSVLQVGTALDPVPLEPARARDTGDATALAAAAFPPYARPPPAGARSRTCTSRGRRRRPSTIEECVREPEARPPRPHEHVEEGACLGEGKGGGWRTAAAPGDR